MRSTTVISSYEQTFSRHGSEVPDGCNVAARACASCYIIGRVWALNGSQRM